MTAALEDFVIIGFGSLYKQKSEKYQKSMAVLEEVSNNFHTPFDSLKKY